MIRPRQRVLQALAKAGLLAMAFAALAEPVQAQISMSGGPIDMSGDHLELIDAQHVAVWSGKVEALQGADRMRAENVKLYFAGSGNATAAAGGKSWGDVQRIEASGTVYFVTPQQTARGDTAVYNVAGDTVTMTGNVVVSQGQSVLRGDRLVIEVKSGHATISSQATGRNSTGRVRGVFYPNASKPKPAAASGGGNP